MDLFGQDVLEGEEIDRRKLASRVFSSRKDLDDLCGILHPEIIKQIKISVDRCDGDVVVIDAPLLIEAGLNEYVDIVVLVTAHRSERLKRAMDRGISAEEAESIMDMQMSDREKEKLADYIINNSDNLEITKEGVEKIWKRK